MLTPRLTRRAALAGLGAAALFPWLRPREARADSTPRKRLVVWFTPCGVVEREFRPAGVDKDVTLGKILAPLAPFKDKLLLLGPSEPTSADNGNLRKERGINMPYPTDNPGKSGEHVLHTILTGRHPSKNVDPQAPALLSVDQRAATKLSAGDPFLSLELGVNAKFNGLNVSASGQVLPTGNNPGFMFDAIFGNLGGQSLAELRRKARRKEVIRLATEQAKSLAPRLSGTDRQRVEAQLTGLAALEQRLSQSFVCEAPKLGTTDPKEWEQPDWDIYTKTPQIAEAQGLLLATALGCGLTHVATMQYGWAAANTRHPFVGADEYHHGISHDAYKGDFSAIPEVEEKYLQVSIWHMQQLASFVARLKAMPESDGSTVLDHTLILVVNELSHGAAHTWQNMPFFLLGDAGGALKSGRYVTFERRYHNDLLVSVLNAVGLDDTTFGDPEFCQGPLPGLT